SGGGGTWCLGDSGPGYSGLGIRDPSLRQRRRARRCLDARSEWWPSPPARSAHARRQATRERILTATARSGRISGFVDFARPARTERDEDFARGRGACRAAIALSEARRLDVSAPRRPYLPRQSA